MAGRYDGSIRINTQIDTKNASAQIMSLENRIVRTADKIASLRSKMDALRDAKVPTQEYREISEQIEKAEAELNRLLEKQEQMQQEGKNNGATWERLKGKIDEAGNTIKYAKGELQELVDTGKAFTLGSNTQEYENLERQLGYLEDDYDVLIQKQREVREKNGDTAASFKKLIASIRNTQNALTKVARTFSKTGRYVKNTNNSLKSGLKTILKYGLGITGLTMLINKLKNISSESLDNLARYSSEYNKEVSLLKSANTQLKNSFATAFAPIIQTAIPYLVQLIKYITKALNAVSQFMAVLSGKSTWIRAKEVQEDYAASLDSTISSAKEAAKALAGFDKLNVLGGNDSDSGSTGTINPEDMFEEVPIDEQTASILTEKIEKLKDVLGDLFNPFKESWEREGEFVIDSWEYALSEISELLKQLGADFLRVWDTPETIDILSDILHIIGDIGLITGHLARNFREAWAENDTGYKILCHIRDIIGVIIGNIRDAADFTAEWADELDFYPLLSKVEEWTESLIPVIDALSGIMTDFYTMVLLPLGKWTLETGLKELLQVFIDFNNKVDWETLRANIQEFWEHLEPFGETVGEGLIIFIGRAADALAEFLNSNEFVSFLTTVENWMDEVTPEDVADALEKIAKGIIALKVGLAAWNTLKVPLNLFGSFLNLLETKKLAKALKNLGGASAGKTLLDGIKSTLISFGGPKGGLIGALKGLFTTDLATIMGAGTATEIGLTIGTALIGGIAAAIGGFNIGKLLGKALNPEGSEWYDNFKWFGEGGFFDAVMPDTTDINTFFSDLTTDLIAFQQMATDVENNPAIANLIEALIGPFATAALEVPNKIEDISKKVGETVAELEDFGKDLQSWWDTDAKKTLSLWGQDINAFWDKSIEPWFTKEKWSEMGENVKSGISGKWTEFTDWWQGTGFFNWWNEDVEPWFEKDKWSFDGIENGLESAWNAAIEAVKKIWNKFAGWLNEKMSWTIDPVTIAGKTVFEGTTISLGKIPMLADGAVIRGGDPFMAVLGDQPRGVTNIETPLPTMVKAFKQAMAECGGMGGGEYTFIAQLNGKAIYEETVRLDRMQKKSTGCSSFA